MSLAGTVGARALSFQPSPSKSAHDPWIAPRRSAVRIRLAPPRERSGRDVGCWHRDGEGAGEIQVCLRPPHAGHVANSTAAGRRFRSRTGTSLPITLKTTPAPRHLGHT